MNRNQLEALLAIAETEGRAAALAAFEAQADAEREASIDATIDFEHDDSAWAEERRIGPTNDDRFDTRGKPLRPLVNEACEPYWM